MANPNEQAAPPQKTSKVIIAVNTPDGIGYFVDSEGNKLFNKQFDEVRSFSEGLAGVKQNGKWGYINTKGEEVIPCIYDRVYDFSDGLACVDQNGKCGFINAKGEVVIPCIYDWAESFSEGLAPVEQNGKWGVINTKGEVVVPCIYRRVALIEGIIHVKEGRGEIGGCGCFNTKGEVLAPSIYDYPVYFSEGLAKVQYDYKWALSTPRVSKSFLAFMTIWGISLKAFPK